VKGYFPAGSPDGRDLIVMFVRDKDGLEDKDHHSASPDSLNDMTTTMFFWDNLSSKSAFETVTIKGGFNIWQGSVTEQSGGINLDGGTSTGSGGGGMTINPGGGISINPGNPSQNTPLQDKPMKYDSLTRLN
jgi:hypothetical protein